LKQDNSTGYGALRSGAGLVDRSHLGRLLVTGADRRSYLQGLLTNDIEALTPGTGCYAALLTAQGRMIADMRVVELGDRILIDLPAEVTEPVRAHLDRFVFSEDVQVRDVSVEQAEIGLYGPNAAVVGTQVLHPANSIDALSLFSVARGTFQGAEVLIVRSDEAGVPGYDLIVDGTLAASLTRALHDAGAIDVDAESAEAVRVEAGRPRFGRDMDSDTIPLEAGIEDRAISRTKGCYVGQEVIIRVLDRGHGRVVRHLVGLSFDDSTDPVQPGSRISAGEREIGRVTSVVNSPALGKTIALGYVHRDFTSPGTRLTVGGSSATVASLPFVPVNAESSASLHS